MTDVPKTTAPSLAGRLHAGQVDKAGKPYIDHLGRVAEILVRRWPDATQDEIDAAWLHDAIEDTTATADDLLAAGISARTVEIVEALTQPEGPSYLEWIETIARSGDQSAIRVKLADNEDNRDPIRVAALPGADERVAKRYEPARRILEAALCSSWWGCIPPGTEVDPGSIRHIWLGSDDQIHQDRIPLDQFSRDRP